MALFSPAQVVGYIAFVLGITAFLQRTDRRLKAFNATQGLFYALHFLLLGNLPASATCVISSVRSFLALKHRSLLLAAAIVAINLAAGAALGKSSSGWLPVVASCAATVALFTLSGIRLRLVLLVSTLLWLANNLISRSIGGTLLEVANATLNIATMIRLARTPSSAELSITEV